MLSITKSRYNGKRLLVLFVLLSTVFITYTVDAQEYGLLRKPSNVTLPEKIQGPLGDPIPAGTYSIGTGGYFPTIDSAFNKLSIDGVAGNVTLELIDELYVAPAVQFGFQLNGPIPGAGPNSRVTIKPALNKNVIIEGNNEALLYLINTSYVTFDGVSLTGPSTLTIHASHNSAYVFNDALDFINNSDNNVIQNITFIVDDNLRASGSGFWHNQTGAFAPDSNLIQNNFVKKAGLGFFVISPTSAVKGQNNVIRGNQIGSETDSLVAFGIQVGRCKNSIIENNIVQNLKVTINGSEQIQSGILASICSGDIIRNNILGNFRANNGYSSSGIFLGGDLNDRGDNVQIYNNMIYNIQSISAQSNSRVTGIEIWYQNNPKVYYNSVYLSGTGTQHLGSAALFMGGTTSTNVDARNNILVNTRDESPYLASAIRVHSGSPLVISDYNDLHYEPNQYSCLVSIVGTNYNTLAEWQATGKDFHSVSIMPCFTSSGLHIDHTTATCLESRGTPITGIDTDIDGEPRHTYLPDIGADEFDGLIPTGAVSAGAYSVGTNGFFPSIENIFNKLETDGINGPVTLEFIDNLYTAPTDSFGFKLNGPISGAGPNSRVTIKPAENKNVTIEGNGLAALYFINTSYITFDGVSLTGSTTLTVHAYENYQFAYNLGLFFIDNSDHNIIQNSIFINDDILRRSPALGVSSLSYTAATPDNNLIQYNFVKQAGIGIYVSAYYSTVPATANSNIIRKNIIGSETDTLISWGIQVERNQNAIIEDNVIDGIRGGSSDFVIAHGIGCWGCSESTIRNNIVHNVNTSYNGGSMGIALIGYGSTVGNGNLVYNNMVYDINSSSNEWYSNIGGIHFEYQNNIKVYYNSVYLSGTGANQQGSAAFYVFGPGSSNIELKNNIFVNTRDESPYCASAIFVPTASNLTSDYNDLYYDDTNNNNCLVRIGSTNYNSLADWQATLNDLHSYVEMPHFISPTDLHIDETIATYLESRGTPIAGIDTDFDGDTRNSTTPDIGADEFDGIVGVEDEETLPTEFALEQNFPNPFNPTTKIKYSVPQSSQVTIKVFDILGNEIALLMDEEKTVGIYELAWNASSLPSGVYFYQLRAGEYVAVKKMLLIK